MSTESRLANEAAAERARVYATFTRDEAWAVGTEIRTRALRARHPITIDIRDAGGTILFHCALDGATANNAEWIDRKYATAMRFEESTKLVAERIIADGDDPMALPWLPMDRYVFGGGGVPVRLAGAGVVAVVSVSGLSADEDHQLIVDALEKHLTPAS